MTTPFVSIITPCFNGADHLDNFFAGILSQTYKNFELIFVDDGSTDDTKIIAEKYEKRLSEKGIKFIYFYQSNSGQAAAMNKGFSIMKGKYFMWVDSDDIMLPTNIEEKVIFLEENPKYDFVLNEAEIVNSSDISKRVDVLRRIQPRGEDDFFSDLIYGNNVIYGPGMILVRTKFFEKAIPQKSIYENREGQNWQIMLPITYEGIWEYIKKPLVKIVVHQDSHSHQKRGFYSQWDRYSAFSEICIKTIMRIPSMSEEEKKKWCKKIKILHNKSKLNLASQHLKWKYYCQAKRELTNEGYKLNVKEWFVMGGLKMIVYKFRRSTKNG